MDLVKIKEVFSDEEFVKSLLNLETPQEVQQALKEKDVDLSIDEITSIGELLTRYANDELTDQDKKVIELASKPVDELSDEDLESVSGGLFILTTVSVGLLCALGATAVLGAGMATGAGFYLHHVTRGRW